MPYYRITITDIYGHISQGIRQDPMADIDVYYGKVRRRAITELKGNLRDIDVVMLTSSCKEVQIHLEKSRNSMEFKPSATPIEFHGKKKFDGYNNGIDKQDVTPA